MTRGAFESKWGPFGRPSGLLGWLAGWLMARANEPMQAMALEVLPVSPDDQVLEIGFGPGQLIKRLASRITSGCVSGVDPSPVMLRQASARNRQAIREGRVELRLGDVARLPFADGTFTKAYALNSFQFWPMPANDLLEVRRVLADGGVLLLGLRVKNPARRFLGHIGFTEAQVREVEGLVGGAGFTEVRTERRERPPDVAAFVAARR